jgi:alkylation response protein AidB-like acyl-CoA dehydrogenase
LVIPSPDEALSALPLREFVERFRRWTDQHDVELAPLLRTIADFGERVAAARRLRALLYDHGWGRVGWPRVAGGLGGTVLHRAAIAEELFRIGWSGPAIYEHLEIVAPTLVRHAAPEFVAEVLPRFLDGSQPWAQGFSEPEAGSDLAALRTRAEEVGDRFVVNGAKIWTSWVTYADWCLALVRTGTTQERHRGLTMLAVDLHSAGVDARPIQQGNGTDELGEVAFTDVEVPRSRVVGPVGEGWNVAMYLLARERGTLSWLKQCAYRQQLATSSKLMGEDHDRQLGEVALQVAGVRATAAHLLGRDAAGTELGPEAAFNKLLMTRTEQQLHNLLRDADGVRTVLPADSPDELTQYQDYLFSRIVTIYGGSQQMQLITVARHLLGLRDG